MSQGPQMQNQGLHCSRRALPVGQEAFYSHCDSSLPPCALQVASHHPADLIKTRSSCSCSGTSHGSPLPGEE